MGAHVALPLPKPPPPKSPTGSHEPSGKREGGVEDMARSSAGRRAVVCAVALCNSVRRQSRCALPDLHAQCHIIIDVIHSVTSS